MGSDDEDDVGVGVGVGVGGGGSRKLNKPFHASEWNPDAVFSLMGKYGEKYALGRGLLRNADWEDVVHTVNSACNAQRTVKQCKDKIDSLKKRYKVEKTRILGSGSSSLSTWIFFNKMDEIMKSVPVTVRGTPKIVRLATIGSCGEESLSTRSSPIRESDSEPEQSSERKEKTVAVDGGSNLDDSSSDDEDGDDDVDDGDDDDDDDDEDPADDDDDDDYDDEEEDDDRVAADCQKKIQQFSDTINNLLLSKKMQQTRIHPVKALADAIVGFSDVYARIEIAKMEVYTDMELQKARLQSRKGNAKKRKMISSGFLDAEMML